MKTRTWPYGTRIKCEVRDIMLLPAGQKVIIMIDSANPEEAFICLYGNGQHKGVNKGSMVTIEFTRGGPMGGYWDIVDQET